MTQTRYPKPSKRICWMTDLHLDQADSKATAKLIRELETSAYEIALVTGDIASARHLPDCLSMLADACGRRPLYITLGNHDYFGTKIQETQDQVSRLCVQISNLHHLSTGGAVELGNRSVLIGGDGWADGQWRGHRDKDIKSPDHRSIRDFQGLSYWGCIRKMRTLGQAAATDIGNRLRPVLRHNKKFIIASHVPAFRTSALYDGEPCDANHQPHFVHAKLGAMLIRIAERNASKSKQFMALSGHTHSHCAGQLTLHQSRMLDTLPTLPPLLRMGAFLFGFSFTNSGDHNSRASLEHIEAMLKAGDGS